jgi:hypothetical protein
MLGNLVFGGRDIEEASNGGWEEMSTLSTGPTNTTIIKKYSN